MTRRPGWPKFIPRVAQRPAVRGGAALSVAYGVQLAVPLFALLYLGRVLGPAPWGDVAATLALGSLGAALPEFGFGFSATRATARAADADAREAVLRGTLGARVLLTLLAVAMVAAIVASPALPPGPGALGYAAVAYVAAHGVAFDWWFDGTQRFARSAALVLVARLPVPLLLVAFVHGPADAPRAVWAYAASGALALALGVVWVAREGGLGRTRAAWVVEALRQSGTLFLSRAGLLVYLNGTVYGLRVLAGPLAAGLYVPAEQVARAACVVLQPISRVLLPRMSASGSRDHARRLRQTTLGYGAMGAALGVGLWLAAPLLPPLVGEAFDGSVPLLRLLAPLPLFVALSQALAVQGLVARGHDRSLAASFLAGAAVCVGLMFWLVPPHGARGMAVAVVAAEAAVALAAALLWRYRTAPTAKPVTAPMP